MAQHDRYISPFSAPATPRTRCSTSSLTTTSSAPGGRLWIALAKAEQRQGLAITDEQIAELEAHKDDINYEDAAAREKLVRHDVMSHVYAYGLQCPKAKGIIHLGATSCYVGDNTDVIIMREGTCSWCAASSIGVLANLAKFAAELQGHALPGLHPLPAGAADDRGQARDAVDERAVHGPCRRSSTRAASLALRGVKGTTGTQASFMELFGGDAAKVKAVEADVCAQMGFARVVPVCGQTYSRKVDYNVLSAVGGLGTERDEDGDRHPAAGELQGDGGAV